MTGATGLIGATTTDRFFRARAGVPAAARVTRGRSRGRAAAGADDDAAAAAVRGTAVVAACAPAGRLHALTRDASRAAGAGHALAIVDAGASHAVRARVAGNVDAGVLDTDIAS